MAAAPFDTASSIYIWPSVCRPGRAKNNVCGPAFLESYSREAISGSESPYSSSRPARAEVSVVKKSDIRRFKGLFILDCTKFTVNWQFGIEIFENLIYNQNRLSINIRKKNVNPLESVNVNPLKSISDNYHNHPGDYRIQRVNQHLIGAGPDSPNPERQYADACFIG
jgi:hypothetical protein